MSDYHVSVLLEEAVCGLNIKKNGVYVDGTAGGGGHSKEIAQKLEGGRLLCIDKDVDALSASKERLKEFANVTFIHSDYKDTLNVLKEEGVEKIDGILLDLGVSSHQIDDKSRGFSYMAEDSPLDMRMDKSGDLTAEYVLNTYSQKELARVFWEYGEEKNSGKISKDIVKTREIKPYKTSGDLVRTIEKFSRKTGKGHPAKRVFQALRIEVNEELTGLYDFITSLPKVMNINARICIITFHSLEDRIVKSAFKYMANPCTCPKEFPVCVCNKKPFGKIITKKPILPKEEEIIKNKRAKSSKLRIFEIGE